MSVLFGRPCFMKHSLITPSLPDRLAMRSRPIGPPTMHQNWDELLFLHWPLPPALLRPLIPEALTVDTYDDQAWIGITPFRMNHVRFAAFPPMPGLMSFLELNVRTYVHRDGIPGIWFFSLDATKSLPVLAARAFFSLPYFRARMSFTNTGPLYEFCSCRRANSARLRVKWQTGPPVGTLDAESLAFFLVERYCFFSGNNARLKMTQVHHDPWILEEATLLDFESSMIGCLGLAEPTAPPILHFSKTLSVDVWSPKPCVSSVPLADAA